MNYLTKHLFQSLVMVLFVSLNLSIQAQSLSQTVIGNAGNLHSVTSEANLHWTVGELAVETFENGSILSEGFHQMYYDTYFTPVWEIEHQLELNLFPNPTSGWVRLENGTNVPLEIKVSNLLGQQIYNTSSDQFQTDFDLAGFPNGLYLFSISQNGQMVKSFKVNKQRH